MIKILATLAAFFIFTTAHAKSSALVFVCSRSNDLYVAVKESGYSCRRFDDALNAAQSAPKDSALLLLAEGYPQTTTTVASNVWTIAMEKQLRVFVEFPDSNAVPRMEFGKPKTTTWERGVIASDVFGAQLPIHRIVTVNGCNYVPCAAAKPWLVVARVAGYDVAPYGIPANASPLLFEVPDRRILVATTKLSSFITGRYAPTRDWKLIWEKVLATLDPKNRYELRWKPVVAPMYSATERLPRNVEHQSIKAAANWIMDSQLLIPQSRTNEIWDLNRRNVGTAPLPSKNPPVNGEYGILEGYGSEIQHDGTQIQHIPLRADCNTESAMVLAFNSMLSRDRRSREVANNLLDFVYFKSDICAGPRADEKNAAFGLIAWGGVSPAWLVGNYGDDDARVMLATIAAAASLDSPKWNDALTKALIANFRTTGKLGFRGDRVDIPELSKHDWKHFSNGEVINYSPHFESYLWACNLWAYRATGYEPFLHKATNAIAMTMKAYPSGWRWGDNSERSRMMLCLSWLVQTEDTPEHRQWLKTVATDLLKRQQPSGTIHEWLGGTGGGHYQIPQSNAAYGTGETPLIQKNGDPASDQLYTTGFALLSLHEAAAATHDTELKAAEDKLAEFLCRVQTRSSKVPYLNGWWFRAFDDQRWDYWASSADVGWGAWSLEAGWAQAWTAAVMALREKHTSFWEFSADVKIKDQFAVWKPRMLD